MVFDIRTVLASYFITDLVSTLVILQLYFQSRKRIAGIIYWLFDILLQSIGLFLILSRSFIPVFYSIVISNFLILTGILLGLIGLERLLKIRRNHIFNYLLLVISVIVQIWFTYIQPDLAIRTLSFSILSFLLFIQCARLLLRNEKSSLLKLTRPVGYIFIGYCIISSIRIIDFFVTVHPSNDFFHSSEFEAFMLFLFQILTILLVYNLSLFFNRWLLLDIKFEEEKFSKAFYSSPYAITLTKFPGGEIIEVNHGFVKITGYEAEEVVGKMVTDLHLWSKVEERVEILSELNSTGKVFDREVKFFKKNGDIINGLFSAEVIDIKDGKFVISTINDITKQKNINKALKDSEKQLRSFFENSMDAIMLTSADGRILTANPAACEMFGYTEGELIEAGKDGIVDKTDPNLKKLLDERQRIGKAKGEIRMIHKNGTVFPAEISSAIFNNNAGERRASIIIRNISDRKKAEETIKHRELLIKEMGKVAKIGGWEFDPITGKGSWTEEIARIHDMDPEDEATLEIGLSFYEGESKVLIENAVKMAIEELIPFDLELELITRNGIHKWVHTIGTPVVENGKVVQIRGSFQDITERKISELALKESEERLRLSLSSANQGLWDLNVQTGEAVVNKEYALMLGYDPETFIETNASWLDRLHPDDKELIAKAYYDYTSGKISEYKVEFRNKTFNGIWKWILSSGKIVTYDSKGNPLRMLGTHTDITERKRIEFNEKLANEVLAVLNNTSDSYKMISDVIRIIKNRTEIEAAGIRLNKGDDFPYFYTEGFSESFVSKEMYLCNYDQDGKLIKDENGNPLLECMCGNILKGKVDRTKSFFTIGGSFQSNNTTLLLANTTERERLARTRNRCNSEGYQSVALIPILSDKEIIGLLQLNDRRENIFTEDMILFYEGLCSSIGIAIKRNEVEEKIKLLNEELEQRIESRTWQLESANKELEAFSYTVSHDLRAPLRAIYGFTKILTDEYAIQLDDEGKRLCNVILENTQNMGRLIDDLLTFSRLNRADINPFYINMRLLIENVINELSKTVDISKIIFNLNEIKGTSGDSSLLKQVWINLIDNAIKFSSTKANPSVEIGSELKDDEVIYFIKDNGVGFDMNYYDKLFGVFQCLHSVKDFEGTGVGLAIVKRIITRHKGKIWAESSINNGSVFYFSLPYIAN